MAEMPRYKCKNCNYSFNRNLESSDMRCPYCSKVGSFVRTGVHDNLFSNL